MHKKAFTLIELLIVITIIAILAGAAMPYVQNYLDDSRISRAKADLSEIRNAIMRYETEKSVFFNPAQGLTDVAEIKKAMEGFQKQLVGPYLMQSLSDPWGRPYVFSNAGSMVVSGAEDGSLDSNIIFRDVRSFMGPARAWWQDNNNNGIVDENDIIDIKFSRAIGGSEKGLTSADANLEVFKPTDRTTAKTTPFGTGAAIEDFASAAPGAQKHPRGNNWIRIKITAGATIMPGDEIKVVEKSIYDCIEASITGKGPIGIYSDDKVQNEGLFTDAAGLTKNYCTEATVTLKSAQ